MTVIVEGAKALYLGAQAHLIEEGREMAWAEKHVRSQPDLKWILGNFVEADNPNENGHIFPLEELETAQASIANKPLNMLHRAHQIMGHFAATEMMWPTGEQAAEQHPHVEALSAFYRYYFPEMLTLLEAAHATGSLFYSMECIPARIGCVADGCNGDFEYMGRTDPSYCSHVNANGGHKKLRAPHFTAGALIVPPVKPGWKKADITELSGLIEENIREAEAAYDQVQADFPHLGPKEWEAMMAHLLAYAAERAELELAKKFDTDKRKKMADEGNALPDGSYPIENVSDLRNAIQAFGRAPAGKRGQVKRHIIKRAKALGAEGALPDDWK